MATTAKLVENGMYVLTRTRMAQVRVDAKVVQAEIPDGEELAYAPALRAGRVQLVQALARLDEQLAAIEAADGKSVSTR